MSGETIDSVRPGLVEERLARLENRVRTLEDEREIL